MEMLKKCLNPKVLIGLGLVVVMLFVFAPKLALAYLPLLIIAACPLSMILMMGSMSGKNKHKGSDALDSLKQRYARGEITKDQLESMKRDIST